MSPVVPCSIANMLLFTGTALAVNCSTRSNWLRVSSKHTLHFVSSPPPSSATLFSQYILSATGTDDSEISEPSKSNESASVKNEDLIPGATFTGKVRSIQPFGAFVDIGAFTDGLVHVSRLSDGFVKDVGSIVSVGQEVKVRLVEVNLETKRIGLSMREKDDGPARKGPPRPNGNQNKMSKLSPGEKLVGTVKNLTRSGAFIALPGEEEGFLPQSEEDDPLTVGQEVNVKVLRMNRGKVTLTMKEEAAGGEKPKSNIETEYSDGVDYVRTNPFMRAFRKNKDISMYLDEREANKISESTEEEVAPVL